MPLAAAKVKFNSFKKSNTNDLKRANTNKIRY